MRPARPATSGFAGRIVVCLQRCLPCPPPAMLHRRRNDIMLRPVKIAVWDCWCPVKVAKRGYMVFIRFLTPGGLLLPFAWLAFHCPSMGRIL